MVLIAILLERNLTHRYFPCFELFYFAELITILTDLLLSPTLAWIIWNAQPLHRNLRFSFIYCVFHLFLVNISRIPLLYAQQFIEDFEEDNYLLIACSLIRYETYAFAPWLILAVTIERFVATHYWPWYEKQERITLLVVIVILAVFEIVAIIITIHIIYQDVLYQPETLRTLRTSAIIIAVMLISVGFMGYCSLLYYNHRELRKLQRRADPNFDKYSLARTYQLRENAIIMKMIVKIIAPAFIFASPIIIFRLVLFMIMENPNYRFFSMILVAMSDLWMALSCLNIQLIFPFFDYRFRKPASRITIFRRIIEMRGMQNSTGRFARKHLIVPERHTQATADHYFQWLEKDWK